VFSAAVEKRNPCAFCIQAEVAQLVEQLIRNQQVTGSSPVFGSLLNDGFCRYEQTQVNIANEVGLVCDEATRERLEMSDASFPSGSRVLGFELHVDDDELLWPGPSHSSANEAEERCKKQEHEYQSFNQHDRLTLLSACL
jgi:hypothetical protein